MTDKKQTAVNASSPQPDKINTEGKSSYRDVIYQASKQKGTKDAVELDADKLFDYKEIKSLENQKYAHPVSSISDVLRTSFKIRFEIL